MMYGFNAGEVFRISLDIEENGRLFYEKAAAVTNNPEVKKIFEDLGQEETKHKERFAALMSELPDTTTKETVWDPQGEIDQYLKMMADLHVFRKSDNVHALLSEAGDEKGALKLAIQFEKDSIVFFAEMQSLSENEESRKKIGQLVREEQEHLKRLSMMLMKIN
jgi:rubrerythrin